MDFSLVRNLQNVSHFLTFNSKYHPVFLIFLFFIFLILKWPDLSLPIWEDEMSYAPFFLWNLDWAFFLPWNYDPTWFMGHPFLHPFILWTAFSVFGPSVFVAKAVSLFLSVFFLMTLYKMIEAVFQDSGTALYSVIFTLFLPVFWVYSSLILADISATAFGFGSIYAFTAKRYKTLLLFSLGMGVIRESSLAFFVPLFLYGLFTPSHRKSLFYLCPGLLVFFLHFFIFFLKTGGWIAHPFVFGTLTHNPDPVFFDFSVILNNIWNHFLPLFLDIYPFAFLAVSAAAIVWMAFLFCLGYRKKLSVKKEIFIPLCMCVLWFSFWILYPDQLPRAYFPLLFFLIPLGIYFIMKVIPFSHVFLVVICAFLAVQTVYMKIHISPLAPEWLRGGYSQINILKSKAFVSYFDKTYSGKIRNSGRKVFSSWPESGFLLYSEYEYVKIPMKIVGSEGCLSDEQSEFKRYGAAIFRHIFEVCIPFYKKIKTSDLFIQIKTPFEDYEVFLHKDLL